MLTVLNTYNKRLHDLLQEEVKKLTSEEGSQDFVFSRIIETSLTFFVRESGEDEDLKKTIYSHVFYNWREFKDSLPKYQDMTIAEYIKAIKILLKKLKKEYSDEDFKGEAGMAEAVEFAIEKTPKMTEEEFMKKKFAVGDMLEADVQKLKEDLKSALESEISSVSERLNNANDLEKVYLKLVVNVDKAESFLKMAESSFPWTVEERKVAVKRSKKELQEFLDKY